MTHKEESLFALAPLNQATSFGDNGQMVVLGSRRPANPDEQRVVDEYQKQTLIMECVEGKAIYAMKLIAELEKEGVRTFNETSAFILALKDEARGKEHQAYIDEFCIRTVQTVGRHILATMEVGATSTAVVVHQPLDPPVPSPEPRGVLQRLFGI